MADCQEFVSLNGGYESCGRRFLVTNELIGPSAVVDHESILREEIC